MLYAVPTEAILATVLEKAVQRMFTETTPVTVGVKVNVLPKPINTECEPTPVPEGAVALAVGEMLEGIGTHVARPVVLSLTK